MYVPIIQTKIRRELGLKTGGKERSQEEKKGGRKGGKEEKEKRTFVKRIGT